ncbi:MAG: LPS biosynthesis protein WbpP [Syntrophus sp. (in: bacteria)]|nr:LPS biosynthesis protein WbpP [Syntrophus sp. (in: bacteria)]
MNHYEKVKQTLREKPKVWLITGVAGFIGSNLLEALLKLDQKVIGIDGFLTGHHRNLDEVRSLVSPSQWANFTFHEGDIRDLEACRKAANGVDVVLHQAALGSVPRSIENPIATNEHNLTGFLNVIVAARDAKVKRFVFATSSSVYGDHPALPKIEDQIGNPLSPYAVTKQVNEKYASVFSRVYGMECIGLRYFNVFGPRQDPDGPYAAVMPKWFAGLISGEEIFINGDGETSRDFCFVENVVQANLLAGCTENPEAVSQVYNIAYGGRTTLNELFDLIRSIVSQSHPEAGAKKPVYKDFRPGDIRHSLANIDKAKSLLEYAPQYSVKDGMEKAAEWYLNYT